jgi:hypothetical protein
LPPPSQKSGPKTAKAVFQNEDGFEIFEVDENNDVVSEPVSVEDFGKKKHRPNDKVSIKYPDGTIKTDVKYKKVEDDVESGKCVVM